MKKLIKLSDTHYIIVDDSRKSLLGKKNYSKYYLGYDYKIYSIDSIGNKPVIGRVTHSTEPLEGEFSSIIYRGYNHISLSEAEEAINGYSVDKMAEEYSSKVNKGHCTDLYPNCDQTLFEISYDDYKAGFKAHQELTKDKLFTLQDVINIIEEAQTTDESMNYPSIEEILKRFIPKTEWECFFDKKGKLKLL